MTAIIRDTATKAELVAALRDTIVLSEAVGPALAPLCRAERLDHGALLIATANTALAHQLQLESTRLIAALNDGLGSPAVRRLRFCAM